MLQVISLETNHVGEVFPGSQREVREYLEERGYVMAATVGGKIYEKVIAYIYIPFICHFFYTDKIFGE